MNEINPGIPDSNKNESEEAKRKREVKEAQEAQDKLVDLVNALEIEIIDAMNKIKAGKSTIVFFDSLKSGQKLKEYLLQQWRNKEIYTLYREAMRFFLFMNINKSDDSFIREYSIEYMPETSGKKKEKIKVSVSETKQPGVLLEKYSYPDGKVVWALRAEEE